MTDPFAPPAVFPLDRLTRAGLNPDALANLQATFGDVESGLRRKFVLLVASVSDADLANDDGTAGEILAGWPPIVSSGSGRELNDQEQAQAGLRPTDGTAFDPTKHTVPEVEDYLDRVPVVTEVDRVAALEQARTDRDPRIGVQSAVDDARERIAAGGI